MNKSHAKNRPTQSIPVEKLRAGDLVVLGTESAEVVLVERADARHVLVAYQGRDDIDYPAGTQLSIQSRA